MVDWILHHYLDIPLKIRDNIGVLGIIEVNVFWSEKKTLKKIIGIDEKELIKLISPVELQIIKNAIENIEKKYNPEIKLMDVNKYNEFNSQIIKWLKTNKYESSKMHLVDNIDRFFGKPINKLTDTQVFLWINNKKNKKI